MKRDFLPGTKQDLRREMRARLRALTLAFRAEASLAICQIAAHLPAFAKAKCVALFAPLASEPDIRLLIDEAWAHGKQVALPLMIPQKNGPQLDWHLVTGWDELAATGKSGLLEPDPLRSPRLNVTALDCVFIPGLAFDHDGFRLGRGGGYYDYFLERAPSGLPRIGIMFACQRVAAVPRESHDQPLPTVVTEDGLVSFSAGREK